MRCLHASTTNLWAEKVSGMLVTVPRQPRVLPASVASDTTHPPCPVIQRASGTTEPRTQEPQGSTPAAHSEPTTAPPGLTSSF